MKLLLVWVVFKDIVLEMLIDLIIVWVLFLVELVHDLVHLPHAPDVLDLGFGLVCPLIDFSLI